MVRAIGNGGEQTDRVSVSSQWARSDLISEDTLPFMTGKVRGVPFRDVTASAVAPHHSREEECTQAPGISRVGCSSLVIRNNHPDQQNVSSAPSKTPVLPAHKVRPVFDPSSGNYFRSFPRASYTGTEWEVTYTIVSEAVMQLPTFYYPSWTAKVDGQQVPVRPQTKTGLIELNVPAGTHIVRAALGRTEAQTAGIVLSLVGLLGTFGLWALGNRQLGPKNS